MKKITNEKAQQPLFQGYAGPVIANFKLLLEAGATCPAPPKDVICALRLQRFQAVS
jgi:hypothetical protein